MGVAWRGMGFCLASEKIHTNKGRQLKAINKNTKRFFVVKNHNWLWDFVLSFF